VEGFLSLVGPSNGVTPCGVLTPLLTGVKELPIELDFAGGTEGLGAVSAQENAGVVLAGDVAKPGCNNFWKLAASTCAASNCSGV